MADFISAMLCFCFVPGCRVCGASRPLLQQCSCFLSQCPACAVTKPGDQPAAEGKLPLKRKTHLAFEAFQEARSPLVTQGSFVCFCLLSQCQQCNGASLPAFMEGSVQTPQRYKRAVQTDVDLINRLGQAATAANHNVYAEETQSLFRRTKPSWSALHEIGRSGETWDFWEIYAGAGHLTEAVLSLGGKAGPCVDKLDRAGLCLDLTQASHRSLCWAILQEAQVRWVHFGFPCCFWTNMSRLTALRAENDWAELREEALRHANFSFHGLWHQHSNNRAGSMEQPKGAGSWRLQSWRELESHGFARYTYASCAWGLTNEFGKPLLKPGALGANRLLRVMERGCQCDTPHGKVEGVVQKGPLKGKKRSEVAGQYTRPWCHALAREIVR